MTPIMTLAGNNLKPNLGCDRLLRVTDWWTFFPFPDQVHPIWPLRVLPEERITVFRLEFTLHPWQAAQAS